MAIILKFQFLLNTAVQSPIRTLFEKQETVALRHDVLSPSGTSKSIRPARHMSVITTSLYPVLCMVEVRGQARLSLRPSCAAEYNVASPNP